MSKRVLLFSIVLIVFTISAYATIIEDMTLTARPYGYTTTIITTSGTGTITYDTSNDEEDFSLTTGAAAFGGATGILNYSLQSFNKTFIKQGWKNIGNPFDAGGDVGTATVGIHKGSSYIYAHKVNNGANWFIRDSTGASYDTGGETITTLWLKLTTNETGGIKTEYSLTGDSSYTILNQSTDADTDFEYVFAQTAVDNSNQARDHSLSASLYYFYIDYFEHTSFNYTSVYNNTHNLENNPYWLNITFNKTGASATLYYNNTEYATTDNGNGVFSTLVTTPKLNADRNISFYWEYDIDGYHENSTPYYHNVRFFDLDNCTLYSTSAFTVSTKDEQTNTLINTNGTFLFNYYLENDATYVKEYINTEYGKNTFNFCKRPSFVELLDYQSHQFSKAGYEPKNFYVYASELTGTWTAYLLQSGANIYQVTYTITDGSLKALEDAWVTIYRLIDGIQTIVFQQKTSLSGQVSVYQDFGYVYNYVINATDYDEKTFSLQPASTIYTISLTSEGESIFDNAYSGVQYRITPSGNQFNITGTNQTISFEIMGSGLEYFGMNITGLNGSCYPSCTNISTSSTGGMVSVDIDIDNPCVFYTSFFFKRPNEDIIYVNNYPNHGVFFIDAANTLLDIIENMKDDTSLNQRSFIAAFVSVMACVVASQLGIIGAGMMIVAVLMNIFFSLPQIGFIHPYMGMVMTTIGTVIFLVLMRE